MTTQTQSFLDGLEVRDGHPVLVNHGIRIDRILKQGALSESYLAYHLGLQLPVMLRVMKRAVREMMSEETWDDLLMCGLKYARVRHHCLTALFDRGVFAGHPYTVTEYLSGIALEERTAERPLTEAQALAFFMPIADGLAALWHSDVLHRGVSPSRCLFGSGGTPKLDCVILPRIPLEPFLVEAHAPFMAGFWPPEEVSGAAEIDARSDMFSFAATMYYALTCSTPFGSGSREQLFERTLHQGAIDIGELKPGLHPEMRKFLMRCLASDPEDRFGSVNDFVAALQELRSSIACPGPFHVSFRGPAVNVQQETSVHRAPVEGTTLGQYELGERLGAGAYGIVFKARHAVLDIPVAIKVLTMELALRNPEYVDMFLREARTAMRIRHKHVIGLFEAGHDHGQHYIVMEYAPHGTVLQRMNHYEGCMPEGEVIQVLREAALGLSAAEEMNIVHRDIKPANLMYGARREIKIADLGLAKRILKEETPLEAAPASLRDDQITLLRGDHAVLGTPAFMAPEAVVTPEKVDVRSDLYSLGITAYQLLTGRVPFDARDPIATMMMHATEPVPPPSRLREDLSPALEAVVLRLLQKKPEDRYASAQELADVMAGL
ncbi:MAG TPA: serine/threonine-protein kinase [Planctomycetota bacterium]|nr:serine/threonine-protein kinase [Planctomycetota bacterium]